MKLSIIRSLIFLCAFNCSNHIAIAQKGLPSFGKIDKADLQMTDCDFDKKAIALKLIDWGNMYYDRGAEGVSDFKQVNERRVRIKILKEKGLEYANVTVPYYSFNNDQKISKIEAYTYNLDESGNVKTSEVGKSSIYIKRINKRYSEVIIAFPEVKVGSVIEYRFKKERDRFWVIDDWNFQDRIPTRYSELQLKVPLIYQFSVRPIVVTMPEVKEKEFSDFISASDGRLITAKMMQKNYIMQNVKGINDEPFMGSARDYRQRLEFQLVRVDFGDGGYSRDFNTTWTDVVKSLTEDDDFGMQLTKELPGAVAVIAEAKLLEDEEARMKFIYNYVRNNFSWNDEEEIYSYDGIVKTWEKKSGSTGDINLLLIALLNRAGIKASPILLSSRENGLVNSMYPFVSQFNMVMAWVPANGKTFVLDATDKTSSYKLIPEKVANTSGFIVEGSAGRWTDLIDNHKYKMMTALHGVIEADGTMKGDCLVTSSEYAKKARVDAWKKDKENFKKEYFSSPGNSVKIEELIVNNAENDSLPLEQKVKFTQALNSSGDYKYFTVNLFTGFEKNPFLEDERLADIDFGYQQEYNIFGNFSIPQGFVFEQLPQNLSLTIPGNGIIFNRIMQSEDNLLSVRISIEFKRNFYAAPEYADFKELYKKMLAALNDQIVIKKKTTP